MSVLTRCFVVALLSLSTVSAIFAVPASAQEAAQPTVAQQLKTIEDQVTNLGERLAMLRALLQNVRPGGKVTIPPYFLDPLKDLQGQYTDIQNRLEALEKSPGMSSIEGANHDLWTALFDIAIGNATAMWAPINPGILFLALYPYAAAYEMGYTAAVEYRAGFGELIASNRALQASISKIRQTAENLKL